MDLFAAIAGAGSLLILIYLFVALLKPEWFS
jgi:K+-transporting ATPase KdpF subunit